MASPSVTYTFANDERVLADSFNQNYSDVINGISDGTKDLTINQCTTKGTMTVSGNEAVGGNLTASGEVGGARSTICMGVFTNSPGGGPSVFWAGTMGRGATGQKEDGYVCNRAGSLRGISLLFNAIDGGRNGFTPCVTKNAATQIILANVATFVTGVFYQTYASYARNLYSFSAGDRLGLKFVGTGVSSGSLNSSIYFEVQYDT